MKKYVCFLSVFVFMLSAIYAQENESSDAITALNPAVNASVDLVKNGCKELAKKNPFIKIDIMLVNGQVTPLGMLWRDLTAERLVQSELPARIQTDKSSACSVEQPALPDYIVYGEGTRCGNSLTYVFFIVDTKDGSIKAGGEGSLKLPEEIFPLLFFTDFSSGELYNPDYLEPDSIDNPVILDFDGPVTERTISPEDDTDWFSCRFDDDLLRYIKVYTESDMDTYMEVYSEDDMYSYITYNDDYFEDGDACVEFPAEPGKTYYIAVKSYSGSETGGYLLQTTADILEISGSEPNDSMELAVPVTAGSSVEELFTGIDDEDWYRIDCSAVSSGSILVITTESGIDTTLELVNKKGDILDSDDDGGMDSNAKITYRTAGEKVLYVVARPYDLNGMPVYTLRTEIIDLSDDPTEPNDDLDFATPVSLGDELPAFSFYYEEDIDCYVFSIESETTVHIYTESNLDTFLVLVDDYWDSVAENDDGGKDGNASITETLDPGTYYIVVGQLPADFQNDGEYRLILETGKKSRGKR